MATNKTYLRFEAYLTPETYEALRAKAYQEHRPMAEIVREILEKALNGKREG